MQPELVASTLCEAGISYMLDGRHLDAQLCAQRVLAADPAHADALHLMGLLCVRSGQYDRAVEWIGRAVRQNPRPDYLSNLGIALKLFRQSETRDYASVIDRVRTELAAAAITGA